MKFSHLTVVALSLFALAILKLGHATNLTDEGRLNPRWTYTDDTETDFYDDDEEYAKQPSYLNQPNQPVQNVIVAKVAPVQAKPPPTYSPPVSAQAYSPPPAPRNPYDTPPGSFSPESYAGPSMSKKYGGPVDLYSSYLSSNSYQQYNQYCTRSYGQKPLITTQDLDNAFHYAWNEVQGYAKVEQNLAYMNVSSAPYSSTARHQIATYLARLSPESFKEKEALIMEFASKYLNKYKCLSKFDTHFLLPTVRIKKRPLKDYQCNHLHSPNAGQNSVDCSTAAKNRYRTPTGVCNNLLHPYWGKKEVCHLRLVASAYEDGVSAPKVNSLKPGYKLPSARLLSNVVHKDRPGRFFYTAAVMAFGQFVNHDITLTLQTRPEVKGGLIDCCKKAAPGQKAPRLHNQCLPIELDANDYQYRTAGKRCISFVRTAPCPLCSLGPREHMNSVTSFLDLSVTYGSSKEEQDKVRAFKKGLLKFTKNKQGNVLLPASDTDDQCTSKSNSHYCFKAGDVRGNQHPMLQTLHNLFLRSHNRHASNLAKINPTWSDEVLFQEAKRINIAEMQHITYEEYLPLIFGPTLGAYYSLNANGYETYDYKSKAQHYRKNLYTTYEPLTDPTTWNEYATAACRYGHSQVLSWYSLIGPTGYNGQNYTAPPGASKSQGFWLRDVYFSSSHLHEGQMDAVIRGLVTDLSMLVDPNAVDDVRHYLYRNPKTEKVGSDLISINIQRQRDHAFPGYIVYLDFCFGEKITTWDGLKKFIPAEVLKQLQTLYAHVADVDLYTGLLSEKKFPDASVGPTTACIVGIQMYGLKFGDRYFYSHGFQAGSFTPDQLLNIKEVSGFANLICKNSDNIDRIQLNPFLPVSKSNPLVACSSLPSINYNLFKSS